MQPINRYSLSVCLFLTLAGTCLAQTSSWVRPGQNGFLIYQMDGRGDRLLDYSSAGYLQGAELPDTSTLFAPEDIITVAPGPGDDQARIEAAIAEIGTRSVKSNGYRGIVQLTAGEFQIAGSLQVSIDGIILRGVGDGFDPVGNTVLRATGTSTRSLVSVGTPTYHSLGLQWGTATGIADKVVPGGATSFRVSDVSGYAVGDAIVVHRNASQAWIESIGMDNINGGPEDLPWDPSDSRYDQIQERQIVRIENDRVFLDAPLAHSIDQRLTTGTMLKYSKDRLTHFGIENIAAVSDFDSSQTGTVNGQTVYTDEAHATNFVDFNVARDSWVRNVSAKNFINATVQVNGAARSITVEDATSLEPVSQVTGGRRYAFNMNGGQFILMKDLHSEQGRHDFVNNSTFSGFNRGPNVFLDAEATDSFSETGPHQRYATGTLYDNVRTDNEFNVRDRYAWGDSHGWAGAHTVVWNSAAESFVVQNPPGARNWLIGSVGTLITDNPVAGASDALGTYDSHGSPIQFNDPENPLDSLYVAQVLEKQRYPNVQMREYWLGDFDQLEYDGVGSADDVYVDANWLAEMEGLGTYYAGMSVTGFDDSSIDHRVPWTFEYELDPGEEVIAAVLTLGTVRLGSHSDNDKLWLDTIASSMSFSSAEWGPIFDGTQVLTLELTGDLGYLQDGRLNGLLADDRPVDWVHLLLYVAVVPEPSTFTLLAVACLICFPLYRRRQFAGS